MGALVIFPGQLDLARREDVTRDNPGLWPWINLDENELPVWWSKLDEQVPEEYWEDTL